MRVRGCAPAVEPAVGAAGPFQGDERAAEGVSSEKFAVEAPALVFENADFDFDSGIAHHRDAFAVYFREGVGGAHHDVGNSFVDNELRARAGAAPMGARLEGDVDGGLAQQRTVGVGDRLHGVDLGMGLAASAMPALAYNTPVGGHYHGSYHGIWRCVKQAVAGKRQRPAHILLVNLHFCIK